MKVIGVLDIQGSVIEHVKMLEGLGVSVVRVKTASDLEAVSGLIIPGGESTVIGKLMAIYGLDKEIRRRVAEGTLAAWGTCAGAILLAKDCGDERVEGLRVMDIVVERNAYGRQLDSFETEVEFGGRAVKAVFIRAPRIVKVGERVEILALRGGEIVAARDGKLMATCFHPELTDDRSVHEYFLEMC